MNGVIILSEVRSGSNWLGSLTNSTGVLGNSDEWFGSHLIDLDPKNVSCDDCIEAVLVKASTENGFFAIKLFPRHLHEFQMAYGCDLIKRLRQRHNVLLLRLTRLDRIAQAVSFSKALQTGKWYSTVVTKDIIAEYDFAKVCRSYFMIGRSYDFWNSYVGVQQLEVDHLVYEDLLSDPHAYIDAVAKHAGNPEIGTVSTELKVQRDLESEVWIERFTRDVSTHEFVEATTASVMPGRNLSNLLRFLRKKQMKPVPYS